MHPLFGDGCFFAFSVVAPQPCADAVCLVHQERARIAYAVIACSADGTAPALSPDASLSSQGCTLLDVIPLPSSTTAHPVDTTTFTDFAVSPWASQWTLLAAFDSAGNVVTSPLGVTHAYFPPPTTTSAPWDVALSLAQAENATDAAVDLDDVDYIAGTPLAGQWQPSLCASRSELPVTVHVGIALTSRLCNGARREEGGRWLYGPLPVHAGVTTRTTLNDSLSVVDGDEVRVAVRCVDAANRSSEWAESDGVVFDSRPPWIGPAGSANATASVTVMNGTAGNGSSPVTGSDLADARFQADYIPRASWDGELFSPVAATVFGPTAGAV